MGDLDRILAILGEIRHRLVRIALVLGPLFGFLLFFELKPISIPVLGFSMPFAYPWPNPFYNISAQVFLAMVAWMLPPGVRLLNVGVGDSIFAQMEIGLLLTLILGMPWIVHEFGAFLVPALRRNERALLRQIGIPATALFALGTGIGIFFLTPFTFRLLFLYVAAMQLEPVLGVQDFVTFALVYSLAFGVVFELPGVRVRVDAARGRQGRRVAEALAGRGARCAHLRDDRHARQLRDHDAPHRGPDDRALPRRRLLRGSLGIPAGRGAEPPSERGRGGVS